MKPNLTWGIVVIALGLTGGGRAQDRGASSGAPKLAIAQVDFHFGLAQPNQELTHTFVLKNEGTAELRVESVAPC